MVKTTGRYFEKLKEFKISNSEPSVSTDIYEGDRPLNSSSITLFIEIVLTSKFLPFLLRAEVFSGKVSLSEYLKSSNVENAPISDEKNSFFHQIFSKHNHKLFLNLVCLI
jgi:hypothetical protein